LWKTIQGVYCVVKVRARLASVLLSHLRINVSSVKRILNNATVCFALSVPSWALWFAFETIKGRGACARITVFMTFQALVCPRVVVETFFTSTKTHRAIHYFSVLDTRGAKVVFVCGSVFVACHTHLVCTIVSLTLIRTIETLISVRIATSKTC
jgi:hypothetical protein